MLGRYDNHPSYTRQIFFVSVTQVDWIGGIGLVRKKSGDIFSSRIPVKQPFLRDLEYTMVAKSKWTISVAICCNVFFFKTIFVHHFFRHFFFQKRILHVSPFFPLLPFFSPKKSPWFHHFPTLIQQKSQCFSLFSTFFTSSSGCWNDDRQVQRGEASVELDRRRILHAICGTDGEVRRTPP